MVELFQLRRNILQDPTPILKYGNGNSKCQSGATTYKNIAQSKLVHIGILTHHDDINSMCQHWKTAKMALETQEIVENRSPVQH